MRIAVAGATGRVGRHVVDVLEGQGHEVVRIARSHGVDVITGEGLDAALAGVECVVDTATGPSADRQEATAFFTTAARNLQAAAHRAGVRRIVVVSIIGIEQFQGGYNAAKVDHERALLAGPVPVRILRAAQFHEFVGQLMDWATRDDVAYLPHVRTQLVAARTVGEALADLATAADPAPMTEIAGPRAEDIVAMATLLAASAGAPAKVEGVSDTGDPDTTLMENGALLPGPDAILAGPTFEEWLAAG